MDSNTLTAYARWLIRGRKGVLAELPSEDVQMKGDAWHARCQELVEEARRLSRAGERRDGMAFDGLKQKALALGREIFVGAEGGCVSGLVAQAFDSEMGRTRSWVDWERDVPDPAVRKLVRELQKWSSWNGEEREKNLSMALVACERRLGAGSQIVHDAQENGKLLRMLQDQAYALGGQTGGEKKLEAQLAEVGLPVCFEEKVRKQFQKGLAARRRYQDAQRHVKARPAVPVTPAAVEAPTFSDDQAEMPVPKWIPADGAHPNALPNLHPAKRWTIVADETGSHFGNAAFDTKGDDSSYVFVVVPDSTSLAPLKPGWHAVDKNLDELLRVGRELRASGCGVLGMPVKGLYRTNRDLWLACAETLLDLALRLLPVEGRTEVQLCIEQRGEYDARANIVLKGLLDNAMYRLSLVDPRKAADIVLTGRFIGKTDSPWNGYADLVAFSRTCARDVRNVLSQFGWEGPCLVSSDPQTVTAFRRCLDLVQRGEALSVGDWESLVACRDARAVGSLVGGLVRTFGEQARASSALWRRYLDYVMAHLDSKAIRMSVLGGQISWLKTYEPDAEQLPPRIRLLWLTAQLALSNHRGGTEFGASGHLSEFRELSAKLRDEDAPLVCFAALHLAVELTDRFEFEAARQLLQPWLEEPVAVPGLRYHGRVLSSLGQHAAFLGDNRAALDLFRRAMRAFARLSDGGQGEIDHTCAYAVIAAMDCCDPALDGLLATYLYGGEPTEVGMIDMACQFAAVGDDEPDSKYAHAILLRHLVSLPEEHPVRKTYVGLAAQWRSSEDGHPWELIDFYRALLLPADAPRRRELLQHALSLCDQGGPTLKVIGCVVAGALLGMSALSVEDYRKRVDEVRRLLPALGPERLAALDGQVAAPLPPLELARRVLPFNFR